MLVVSTYYLILDVANRLCDKSNSNQNRLGRTVHCDHVQPPDEMLREIRRTLVDEWNPALTTLTIDPSSILRSQQWSIAPALDKSKTVLEPLHQTPREKSKAARTVNVATGTPVSSSATSPRSRLRRHPSDAVHFPGVYMSIHGSDWASRDAL